jgi:hypothetical protein
MIYDILPLRDDSSGSNTFEVLGALESQSTIMGGVNPYSAVSITGKSLSGLHGLIN